MGSGGKDRAILAAEKRAWIKPYQTYCAQTRGPAGTLFFVFKTAQDGLVTVRDILAAGKYTFNAREVPVQQVRLLGVSCVLAPLQPQSDCE